MRTLAEEPAAEAKLELMEVNGFGEVKKDVGDDGENGSGVEVEGATAGAGAGTDGNSGEQKPARVRIADCNRANDHANEISRPAKRAPREDREKMTKGRKWVCLYKAARTKTTS